ncbi:MAG TPA: M14 family zinc carboxypeptidase [Patescibacteria group bacterium]|nr:M14 family zinc carboxypeptidase [Patescibacteria group bacterium]
MKPKKAHATPRATQKAAVRSTRYQGSWNWAGGGLLGPSSTRFELSVMEPAYFGCSTKCSLADPGFYGQSANLNVTGLMYCSSLLEVNHSQLAIHGGAGLLLLFLTGAIGRAADGATLSPGELASEPQGFEFIDTSFENASPLWYDFDTDGTIRLHLLYDHERSSANRAAGHFHFLIQAKAGSQFTLEFLNLDNVWNGRPGSVANELKTAVVSSDGRLWTPISLRALPENRVQLKVQMPGPKLYVARVEPYRLSDLEGLLSSIKSNPLVQIDTIGKTVQGRPLELLRLGNPEAPHRVFLRARAHAWEAGSSWVIEGFIRRFLADDELAKACRSRYCVYILPMANKDGVTGGRTRFNLQGKDLNRDWDKMADPVLAPENYALEKWLQRAIQARHKPDLALEFHNDGSGRLQLSRSASPDLKGYLERMSTLERLLRQYTWFTEGSTGESFHNPGSLGEGWFARYGIDAAVHELNCNWIQGLKDYPSARHWQDYGGSLVAVFKNYFEQTKR